MKETKTIDKNRQCITGGIFYCRDSAGFSVSASTKLSCILTGQCFEIGNFSYRQTSFLPILRKTYSQHNELLTKIK